MSVYLCQFKIFPMATFGNMFRGCIGLDDFGGCFDCGRFGSCHFVESCAERVGSISHLILSEEGFSFRFIRSGAGEFRDDGDTAFAPVLMTSGTFSSPDGKTKASGLTVLGIDSRFLNFRKVTNA